jgi:hypothetical protein
MFVLDAVDTLTQSVVAFSLSVNVEKQQSPFHLVVRLHPGRGRHTLIIPVTVLVGKVGTTIFHPRQNQNGAVYSPRIQNGGRGDPVKLHIVVLLLQRVGIPQLDFIDEEGLQLADPQVLVPAGEFSNRLHDVDVQTPVQIRVGPAAPHDVCGFYRDCQTFSQVLRGNLRRLLAATAVKNSATTDTTRIFARVTEVSSDASSFY